MRAPFSPTKTLLRGMLSRQDVRRMLAAREQRIERDYETLALANLEMAPHARRLLRRRTRAA